MIELRKANDRGHTRTGWLDSRHSFSFGGYRDPERMGFRALRVINEDFIAPGTGFGLHPHRDMEILTLLLEGELEHRDDTGSRALLRPGRVQMMSAGTGIVHSEVNPSSTHAAHLLQLWIEPARRGGAPRYQERDFERDRDGLQRIASADGEGGSFELRQDARVYTLRLGEGEACVERLQPDRFGWVQVVRGAARLNGHAVEAGDGAALSRESELELTTPDGAEFLVFDLA